MTTITRVGVDLAKNVFHVHGVDSKGRKLWQKKLTRSKWVDQVCEKLVPGGEIGMESCASAHHWAREFGRKGFQVRLIVAQFVKPFVKSNKNDSVDAEAISEAMSRPSMRFVTPKTVDQQDLQAMHRIRNELVCHRTAKANQIRGLVGEYGIVAPVGINQLRQAIPCWLEDACNGLTALFRELLMELWSDLKQLDDRVDEMDSRLTLQAKANPVSQKLLEIKGVGVLTATA